MNRKHLRAAGLLAIVVCLVGFSGPAQAVTFPAAGQDIFDGPLKHNAWIYALNQEVTGNFSGTTVVDRSDPVPDTTGDGDERVDTVMSSMNMTGDVSGMPAILTLQPTNPTVGQILDTNPDPADSFPAESFFDVYFQITIPELGVTLHNANALRMESIIDQIPPDLGKTPYYWVGNHDPSYIEEVMLYDQTGLPWGYVTYGEHPEPATVVMLVFGGLTLGGWALIRRRRKA